MQLLQSIEIKDKKDSLKYAYAFMMCKKLYIKECSFFNPNPKQIDSEHIYPRDAFSATYTESNLPPWEEFKSNPIHLSSPSFNCVGSLDQADKQRLMCVSVENNVLFCCYGDYEAKAQKIIREILDIHLNLKW